MAVLNPTALPHIPLVGPRGARSVSWPSVPAGVFTAPAMLAVALVAAFLLTLLGSAVLGRATVGSAPATAAAVPVVAESAAHPAWTVEPGDTLWSVAQTVAPGADPRAVVLELRVLNGLSPQHVLQAGEVLQVPRGS